MAVLSKHDLPSNHFRIMVTSTELPKYAKLCEAYDFVSELWNESQFTLKLHESLREITPSSGEKVVLVKKFNRAIWTKQVITWGKENGYRLAFPTEREAFSKANRDLQRLFSIMDLGSFVHDDDYRLVPVLHELEGERYLGHGSLDDGSEHRFLFIRI